MAVGQGAVQSLRGAGGMGTSLRHCLMRATPRFLWCFPADVPCAKANLESTKGAEMGEGIALVPSWVGDLLVP